MQGLYDVNGHVEQLPVLDCIYGVQYNLNMQVSDLRSEIHRKSNNKFAEGGNDILVYVGRQGL